MRWFNMMESRPEVEEVRSSSSGEIFKKLCILETPQWPEDMPPFEQLSKSILAARDAVRNCVTDKQTRLQLKTSQPTTEHPAAPVGIKFSDIKQKLLDGGFEARYTENLLAESEVIVPWDQIPADLDPKSGGLSEDRARRKRRQIDNLVRFTRSLIQDGASVVDFCGGGGHLSLVLGWMFPKVEVHLVDRSAVHLALAKRRISKLADNGVDLSNVHIHNCDLRDWKMNNFDLGLAIHSCGVLCDLVQERCIQANAAYLIVPCCFGSLKNNNSSTEIKVPRSSKWACALQVKKIEYDVLCSVADRGSESWKAGSEENADARFAMAVIDEDRQARASEIGYNHLFHLTLQPLTITPKNEVIIGAPPHFAPPRATSSNWLGETREGLTITQVAMSSGLT